MKKLIAEFIGTFWLVLGGCGSAILAAGFPGGMGIGFVGVSLAFGLTVLTMAYAVGHISGGHFNPAVSVGLWLGGRFEAKDLPGYIVSQVFGGIAGAAVLYLIASGQEGWATNGFASNGYGDHSPGQYGMVACLVTEIVMTFMFLMIILGATQSTAPGGFAGMAIGLGLTLVHLISIPVTNTSVNPARSTAAAIFEGGWAVEQLWLFWLAPIIGAALAGLVHKYVLDGTGINVDGRAKNKRG
ncbi:MAG: aquaporin Z [Bacteroidetes bacterium]|nr:aquaporin Z [Bacteroidota bacterium]MBL0015904.1 aquaporin Z [Bacteroidota bacterium]MBP6641201.1 aquaporin Z [Bacteroidia bacterium]